MICYGDGGDGGGQKSYTVCQKSVRSIQAIAEGKPWAADEQPGATIVVSGTGNTIFSDWQTISRLT